MSLFPWKAADNARLSARTATGTGPQAASNAPFKEKRREVRKGEATAPPDPLPETRVESGSVSAASGCPLAGAGIHPKGRDWRRRQSHPGGRQPAGRERYRGRVTCRRRPHRFGPQGFPGSPTAHCGSGPDAKESSRPPPRRIPTER